MCGVGCHAVIARGRDQQIAASYLSTGSIALNSTEVGEIWPEADQCITLKYQDIKHIQRTILCLAVFYLLVLLSDFWCSGYLITLVRINIRRE